MLSIELEPELEKILENMAEQEHSSIDKIIERLIHQYFKQDSELLIDAIKGLPKLPSFANQDALSLQRALRDEWN